MKILSLFGGISATNKALKTIGIENKVISDSQAYKCLGNSFTVRIVEHILKTIWNI